MTKSESNEDLRLDKWLWAARFFKTRALASEAIKGGKVEVNGNRVKPAKYIAPGDWLLVRRGPFEHDVTVLAVSRQRGPAAEAARLYVETEDSRARRDALTKQLEIDAASRPRFASGRPTKKERRDMVRFGKERE